MDRRNTLAALGVGLLALPVAAFGALYWTVSRPGGDPLPLPPIATSLASDAGRALLASARSADHDRLLAAFQSQEKGSWCGVASAVTVLGARGAALSQEDLFSPQASEVRSFWRTTFGGMPIADLGGLLEAHGARAEVFYAEDGSVDGFRSELARNSAAPDDFLIVNYDRRIVGGKAEATCPPSRPGTGKATSCCCSTPPATSTHPTGSRWRRCSGPWTLRTRRAAARADGWWFADTEEGRAALVGLRRGSPHSGGARRAGGGERSGNPL